MTPADLTAGQLALLALPILPNLWTIWHAMRHDFPGERESKVSEKRTVFFGMALPGGAALYAAAIGAK